MDKIASHLAERILDHVSDVPWPVTAFLTPIHGRHPKLELHRANDPACDRLRSMRRTHEVGTYTIKASHVAVSEDVAEVLKRLA